MVCFNAALSNFGSGGKLKNEAFKGEKQKKERKSARGERFESVRTQTTLDKSAPATAAPKSHF